MADKTAANNLQNETINGNLIARLSDFLLLIMFHRPNNAVYRPVKDY